MIRVIVVDDHELFRLGVKTVIENRQTDIDIVGEAETGEELFRLLEKVEVDIILLDIVLPDMHGTEIVRLLRITYPKIKILAISPANTMETVEAMVDLGIDGFISKRVGTMDVLLEAIGMVASGLEYFGKDISDIIYQIYAAKEKTSKVSREFTKQELRIIVLSQEGLSGKQIAERLSISPRTVDNHKNNIFRKLGINSTLEMVQYALRKGIIRMESVYG